MCTLELESLPPATVATVETDGIDRVEKGESPLSYKLRRPGTGLLGGEIN